MNNLSSKERKVFNNMSQVLDANVDLGDKIYDIISHLGKAGTPVNAANASVVLTVSSIVVDGETITIDNPAKTGVDVYEFLADDAQTKTAQSNIAIDITSKTTKAVGTLTIDTQPTSGDKMTIGTKVYTFVPVGTDTADGEISIGADLAGAQAAIVAAVNGTDSINSPHPLVTISEFETDSATITALIGGTAGNSIVTTETFTAETNIFGGGTLATGTNCSGANAITLIAAAITSDDTQGVGAVAGSGIVTLTADGAGASGNQIVVGETLANAEFADGATKLSGGVDGTVASAGTILVDASYIYTCVADNSVTGKNWRRISLGSAY